MEKKEYHTPQNTIVELEGDFLQYGVVTSDMDEGDEFSKERNVFNEDSEDIDAQNLW